jgi:hypothetical protein
VTRYAFFFGQFEDSLLPVQPPRLAVASGRAAWLATHAAGGFDITERLSTARVGATETL